MLSPHQEKYLAWSLTRKRGSSDDEKFTGVLTEAKVDLNPHQVEAALFAFRSPLSKGAILADEVGLGKTIEAAIVISQHWAERKRHVLIITPASLRKQWSSELESKFYLPTTILERKNFNEILNKTYSNPFESEIFITICSYQFAKKQIEHIKRVDWDLVVMDEAHKLRNVYKPSSKTSLVLKEGLSSYRKMLLTATPLQNDVKDLYGLVSIIDDNLFGSLKGFSDYYGKVALRDETAYTSLRERIEPVIHRTLRKDVQEYVRFTERIPFVQEYYPSEAEVELYERVTSYLDKDECYGLPNNQRQLIEMIFYKLLSSSSFAIAGTLATIIKRLQKIVKDSENYVQNTFEDALRDEVDTYDEYAEEWSDEDNEEFDGEIEDVENRQLTKQEILNIKEEILELQQCNELALSIASNNKGECLLKALDVSFNNKRSKGEPEKALVFTESTRTQLYIRDLLESNGYNGKVVIFNGSNTDEKSKSVYQEWIRKYANTSKLSDSKTANKRQALVDYFEETAQIMVATEAAAEGINFQFCSLIVNYDLPWNPQRIEQRIGRCHRYGQRNDVVVVNFINKLNRADQRVYEILDQKYNLFKGVFGASDDVLGKVMDGVDFEQRLLKIYKSCRDVHEIDAAFDALQEELKDSIEATLSKTQISLIENFDEDVVRKLKIRMDSDLIKISEFSRQLWDLTISILKPLIEIKDPTSYKFILSKKPTQLIGITTGLYQLGKDVEGAFTYRIGHPLAQWVIESAKKSVTPPAEIMFDYSSHNLKISLFEKFKGESGHMSLYLIKNRTIKESEEHFIFVVIDSNGNRLDDEFAIKLLNLKVLSVNPCVICSKESYNEILKEKLTKLVSDIEKRNKIFISEEVEKIERWADDQTYAAEQELKEIKKELKEKTRLVKNTDHGSQMIVLLHDIQKLQNLQKTKRDKLFRVEDEISTNRIELIGKANQALESNIEKELLFNIKWIIK